MPISLSTLQQTLDTSKIQGFIKLSDDGASVKSYGGGFLARHFGLYPKPSADENNAVRRAFYESVSSSFRCRGEVLDMLRRDLGIGADGSSTSGQQLGVREARDILSRVKAATDELSANVKERQSVMAELEEGGYLEGAIRQHVSDRLGLGNQDISETRLHNADARDIRRYAMDATANRTARANLFAQLQKDGLCQGEIEGRVRAMLHLDDAEEVLNPLTPEDRATITRFANESSARVHSERIAAHQLPPADELERLVSADDLATCKATLANPGASEKEINRVACCISKFSMAKQSESLEGEVKDALAQLSADTGLDFSGMQDSLFDKIKRGVMSRHDSSTAAVPVTPEQVRSEFTAELAKVISDKKAMLDMISAEAPNLSPTEMSYLRNALVTVQEFRKPAQLQTVLKYRDATLPLMRLFCKGDVNEAEYLDAFRATSSSITAACKEYGGKEIPDANETSTIGRILVEVGKAAIENETGKPLPNGDTIKSLISRHIRQGYDVFKQISDKKPSDYRGSNTAINAGLYVDLGTAETLAVYCGIELDIAPRAEGTEPPSPAFDKYLEGLGITRVPKNIVNGQRLDIKLGSAFQEMMLGSLQSSLARADQADKYPGIFESFFDGLKDYARIGTSLKLGDTYVSRMNDSMPARELTPAYFRPMLEKIEPFFSEDPVNGARASRIIGDLVHQGLAGIFMTSSVQTREPFDFLLNENSAHQLDFTVSRSDNGSYHIRYNGVYRYRMTMGKEGLAYLDATRSLVRYEAKLEISFDEHGKPHIALEQPPTISGTLTPSGSTYGDVSAIREILDARTDAEVDISGLTLSGALQKPDFMQAAVAQAKKGNRTAVIDLVHAQAITKSDTELLDLIGLDQTLVSQMISGTAGDESTPRLGKESIRRLLDPATRDAAIHELADMAQLIADAEWIERAPDIHAEALNLVTIAGLSATSASHNQSDAKLVMDFISESDDQNVRNILADLQSDDPGKVAAAKTRAHDIAHEQRQQLGIKLLETHIKGLTDEDISYLRKYIPASQYGEALQHIVDRDSYLEASVSFFESLVETARMLEREAIMAAQQQV